MLGTGAGSMLIGVHAGWNFTTWALSGAGGGGLWKMTIPDGMTDRVQSIGMAAYLIWMGLTAAGLWMWKSKDWTITTGTRQHPPKG
jgi:hypothetical protein